MSVITVPVSDGENEFIEDLVKSGTAASKAHAMRMAIQLLQEEQLLTQIRKSQREIKEGKGLKGDLKELSKRFK